MLSLGDFKASKISHNKTIDYFFIPWWINLSATVVFSTFCLVFGVSFPTSGKFWLVALAVAGCSNVIASSLKILAFKNDKVSRVSPIFYSESVFGFLIDYFAFNVEFGVMQLAGILLVFVMFGAKLFVAFYYNS